MDDTTQHHLNTLDRMLKKEPRGPNGERQINLVGARKCSRDLREHLAVNGNALAEIAQCVPRDDEWKSAADLIEGVAAILDRHGVERPAEYPSTWK